MAALPQLSSSRLLPVVVLAGLAACAGGPSEPPATPAEKPAAAPTPAVAPAAPAVAEKPVADADGNVPLPKVDLTTIPAGPEGEEIRRGLALVKDTHRLLPDNVGDKLNCTNCHLDAGTRAKAAPYIGVTDRYPRYRKRSGKVDDIQDRVNGCFERSMNGTALAKDSPEMGAIVAYMTWLGKDVEDGKKLQDVGMPRITAPEEPSAERGEQLYAAKCAACHQADGSGMMLPDGATMYPALWGDHSYNIGAGMARLHTAAAFVKWNMPFGMGGSLSDQEAYDIASYFIFQDRPDLAKKSGDWPNDEKPDDARY